ncbi:hypothetical protein HKX48_000794 [Thoreauomyces humboldtii]|nr:hypothetical protein HKX48_000794 [Thoreauomyces humboldtii]
MPITNAELWVEQSDISRAKVVEVPVRDLNDNEILCRIDSFGMSANNVTYAMLGKSYRYFDFFPVSEDAPAGKYGKVPVWAMATVTSSKHPRIPTGERLYGYFPLARYEIIKPSDAINSAWFYTSRPHLPEDRKVYNQLFRQSNDPFYDARHEGEMLLFRPLYWTSFFLSDYIQTQKAFGATVVVISSASSKTAFCYAWLAKESGLETIALTSTSNVEYVKRLGFYDTVLTYDHIAEIPRKPSLYVDVSGSKKLAHDVVEHLGKDCKRALSVGMSNAGEARGTFPEGTELFFAPPWMKKRQEELRGTLPNIMAASWKRAMDRVEQWVTIRRESGAENVEKIWRTMVNGRTPPDVGYVLSLWEGQKVFDNGSGTLSSISGQSKI